ncbi:protein of unknown function [Pedobacter nyackensis]|uniref:Uncharacterized protein n=2 Tax=Pedobacter nyackensis TaxID=475255 RepID=A0A1W2DWW7_9SPHI|nr:protein of unknown function [Pedobacter nyackensis]
MTARSCQLGNDRQFKNMKKKNKCVPATENFRKGLMARGWLMAITICVYSLLSSLSLFAQDGEAGIREATEKVVSYFDTGCDLMYAIGAVVGLIGAVKVFNKWNAGEPDTNKVAAAWFGSCIFLVVVATVLKSFFGI